jgi:hypothetical protein
VFKTSGHPALKSEPTHLHLHGLQPADSARRTECASQEPCLFAASHGNTACVPKKKGRAMWTVVGTRNTEHMPCSQFQLRPEQRAMENWAEPNRGPTVFASCIQRRPIYAADRRPLVHGSKDQGKPENRTAGLPLVVSSTRRRGACGSSGVQAAR